MLAAIDVVIDEDFYGTSLPEYKVVADTYGLADAPQPLSFVEN